MSRLINHKDVTVKIYQFFIYKFGCSNLLARQLYSMVVAVVVWIFYTYLSPRFQMMLDFCLYVLCHGELDCLTLKHHVQHVVTIYYQTVMFFMF